MKVLTARITFVGCALTLMAGCGSPNGPGPADVRDAAQDSAVDRDATPDAPDSPGDSDIYLDTGTDTPDIKADETSASDADAAAGSDAEVESDHGGYVCSPASTNEGSCSSFWTCLSECSGENSEACRTECEAWINAEGQANNIVLQECITSKCPDETTLEAQLACARKACPNDYFGCFNGCDNITCSSEQSCVKYCWETAMEASPTPDVIASLDLCVVDCGKESTEAAQVDFNALLTCVTAECAASCVDSTSAECWQCYGLGLMSYYNSGTCYNEWMDCDPGYDEGEP